VLIRVIQLGCMRLCIFLFIDLLLFLYFCHRDVYLLNRDDGIE